MDCNKCLSVCKAECCSDLAPLPANYPSDYYLNIQRQPTKIIELDRGHINALTDSGKCIFLSEENQCSIYENRPPICQKFGNESHPLLTCIYQSKDGRVRSRNEKRQIERSLHGLVPMKLNLNYEK